MKEKAVITILGTAGVDVKTLNLRSKASYKTKNGEKEYYNIFEHLIQTYGDEYDIVPFYTELSRQANELILQNTMPDLDTKPIFENAQEIKDEKDFDKIFAQIDEMISQNYRKTILDVSHGYRHLPILATVDALIQNFSNPDKIEKIIFAKEIEQFKLYEIIDLKEYLDLANIAFILTAFNKNYTVANHIKSTKYPHLIDALQDFSDDIMALNISHLFQNSATNLVAQLKSINDKSIKNQAINLKKNIEKLLKFTKFKPHEQYYALSKILFAKNYILLSLTLIFESLRLYVADKFQSINKEFYDIVTRNEQYNTYDICNFFIGLLNLEYEKLKLLYKDPNNFDTEQRKRLKESEQNGKQTYPLTKNEFIKIQNSFQNKDKFADLYKRIKEKRNTLAHIDSKGTNFQSIENSISDLILEYEDLTGIG